MKRLFIWPLTLGWLAMIPAGCSDTSTTRKETKITTPGGTTTVTTEKEVKRTGDNPPPAP